MMGAYFRIMVDRVEVVESLNYIYILGGRGGGGVNHLMLFGVP